ncbi:MurR/RpiR family transcriptional regulator [Anaerosacchariphilus polymeriproducens]|uniref:MurR/RpiR family transcriptional regulator n=1 Tax=Anaerosacchariphilus polymeriproducens TaxID=1812858 RepID=A0A371AR52_9FIRM|nr:MurR/RpiR family transcriptional regulator [Anaerosacchariphilus polymeriproducens]RDU22038.1 MurR/RpiR family transcriptional regulator [Anaerosacchariphilus polymeriproducens]
MEQNPFIIIQSQYPSFHKVEKKIADFILNNTKEVIELSIQQFAAKLNIAESSIVRFCKTIGLSGFSDLKIRLAAHTQKPAIQTIFEELKTEDDMETITRKVFSCNIDTLEQSLNSLDYNMIAESVEYLNNASHIYILGVGASASLAEDFYIRLMRIGIPATAITDSHLSLIIASQLNLTDVLVGISHTGQTTEVISAMREAQAHKAKTISITGYSKTPISQVSDICLELYSPKQLFISPRVTQVSIIDSLYVGLAIRQKESVIKHIKEMNRVLDPLRLKS